MNKFTWQAAANNHPTTASTPYNIAQANEYQSKGACAELAGVMVLYRARMTACGHQIAFTQIHRTIAAQAALYAQGRSKPGPKVTDALPSQSAHCAYENDTPASQAFDICQRKGAKLSWEMKGEDSKFWSDARDTGKMLGLTWGATFNNPPRDFGHFQLSTFQKGHP